MTVESAVPALDTPPVSRSGAHYDGDGAAFALFSSVADAVELCLFDDASSNALAQAADAAVWFGVPTSFTGEQRVRLHVADVWSNILLVGARVRLRTVSRLTRSERAGAASRAAVVALSDA